MHDNDENGVWAIVGSAGKKYIGWVPGDVATRFQEGRPIRLTNAWTYIEMDLPVQGPQGMGIQHVTHCRPTNNCAAAADFSVVADMLHLFTDMTDEDQRRNKALVEQVAQVAIRARAERAGIQLVGPGGMPSESNRPPRLS